MIAYHAKDWFNTIQKFEQEAGFKIYHGFEATEASFQLALTMPEGHDGGRLIEEYKKLVAKRIKERLLGGKA